MNTSTKVFATLALSAAVGEKIKNTESGYLSEAGEKLRSAGFIATGAYPSAHLTEKKTEDIENAVMRLLSKPLQPYDILSMLIAGLIDIRAKCKPERYALIDPVVAAAQDCIDIYDDLFWQDNHALFMMLHTKEVKNRKAVDHDAAFDRYCAWLES
jgi:hypothetical protein